MAAGRRWRQFSLTSLLAVTAVAGCATFAAHWFASWRRAQAAEHAFVAAEAKWDAGIGRFEEVREASSKLLDAESALPFADRRAAQIAYLNRTARLEKRVAGMLALAMFGSREAFKQHETWALQLRAEREEWESRLGVKALTQSEPIGGRLSD